MFKKFFNIFWKKNTRFKDKVFREKRKFYMFSWKKSSSFFCKRKKNNKFQLKINFKLDKKKILYITFIWIVISLISIVYVLKWWYFSIKKINIEIQDNITDEDIAYKSVDLIRNKSIFLENKENIIKKIIDYQKNIRDIYISKRLPDTINIKLKSYPILMKINYNDNIYFLTSNWVLIPYKKINDKKDLIKINVIDKKINKYKIISYKKIFKKEKIKKIYLLINSFRNNLIDHHIWKIIYYKNERELHIITKNKTIFIFSLEEDIEKQLKKLIVFHKEKDKKLKYVYIDLRIEDKLYLCPYKNEFQCLRNYKRIYWKKMAK